MPKPRPPYLQREIDRHGKTRWYVRIRPNPRIRIYGEYGSQEFIAAYQSALLGIKPAKQTYKSNSLAWLITEYRKSLLWLELSPTTKKQRENIFISVIKKAGDKPFKAVTKKVIMASRDERAATPAAANNFLKTMNGLFRWAIEYEHITENPCTGVKSVKPTNRDGFIAWTEKDVELYYKKWPLGTKERVWLDMLLFTGLRRGDAVRIGLNHVTDGIITLKTEKSKFQIPVILPILPILQKTLEAGKIGETTFICGTQGKALTKEAFGNMFRAACRASGVDKSAHGVRKISATRAANAGATVAQLMAIYGWSDPRMASHYTKTADREKLAKNSINKLIKG